MEISNKKIPLDEFLSLRKDVLRMWPTGAGAEDLDAAIAYHKAQSDNKNFAAVMKNLTNLEQLWSEKEK